MYNMAEQYGQILSELIQQHDNVVTLTNELKFNPACTESIQDIQQQLAFLFRPQFMRTTDIWPRYPRYMKALLIRVDRLRYAPQKDQTKSLAIKPYQEQFTQRLETLPAGQPTPRLLQFALSLEEFRINLFAPEIGTIEKISPKRLDKMWAEI